MASILTNYNSSLATDPLRSFRFSATFSPVSSTGSDAPFNTAITTGWVGGFSSISGLNINTQNIPYREGGYNTTVHQIPGMTTFSPITFSRGVMFGNDQAMKWMRGLFAAAQGEGLNAGSAGTTGAAGFRVNVSIQVNNHPDTSTTTDDPQLKFVVHNAWITSVSYSDLDATNGALLFETMTLIHEGLSVGFTGSNGIATDSTQTTVLI